MIVGDSHHKTETAACQIHKIFAINFTSRFSIPRMDLGIYTILVFAKLNSIAASLSARQLRLTTKREKPPSSGDSLCPRYNNIFSTQVHLQHLCRITSSRKLSTIDWVGHSRSSHCIGHGSTWQWSKASSLFVMIL